MNSKDKFAEYTILVDTRFLNTHIHAIRSILSQKLQRELPPLDLVLWLDCLALEAGIEAGENEIQVILVHDPETEHLDGCLPQTLADVDGKACRTPLGEYAFYSVSGEHLSDNGSVFLDLSFLLASDKQIKKVLLVPDNTLADTQLYDKLGEALAAREEQMLASVCLFGMQKPPRLHPGCRWNTIVSSLAFALGIHPDEMK